MTANAASASRQSVTSISALIASSVNRSPKPGDDARGEQLVQRFDVGRHARHEPADGIPVEEDDGQPLHVREDRRVADRASRAGRAGSVSIVSPYWQANAMTSDAGEEQRRSPRRAPIARRERDVDHALRHERADELQQSVEHQAAERRGDEPSVRADVHDQPPHQTRVVRFADDVLFVNRHGSEANRDALPAARRRSARHCRLFRQSLVHPLR